MLVAWAVRLFPAGSLLALATLPLSWVTVRGAARAEATPDLIPHLGCNVLIVLVTPTLLAGGPFLGK